MMPLMHPKGHILIPENSKKSKYTWQNESHIINSANIVGHLSTATTKLFHVHVDEQLNTSQTGHLGNTKGI